MANSRPAPRRWLCETWEERDALVRRYGKDRLRITVIEEIDDFDIMTIKYQVEELPSPEAPSGNSQPPR
jgi:hypothetical protein